MASTTEKNERSGPPQGFWYLAGATLVILALAVSWRIVQSSGNVALDVGKDGFSIKLDEAKDELMQAQQELTKVKNDLQARSDALNKAASELNEKENRISELLAKLDAESQKLAANGSATAEGTAALTAELGEVKAINPTVTVPDPAPTTATLSVVARRLQQVDRITSELPASAAARAARVP